MPKPKKAKIELYPITEKGAEQFVPKAKYISSRAAQLSKKPDKGGLGVAVETSVFKELMKIAESNGELAAESPDEMVKAFDLIKVDLKRAGEHLEELEEKKAEEQKKELALLEEKKNYEAELFSSVGDAESLKNFDQVFDTTNRNRCVPKEGVEVTDKQLIGALAMGFSLEDMSDWVQGDAVRQLEDRGHQNVVSAIAEKFKVPYSTLSAKARVCREIPVSERDKLTIPFGTVATIQNAKFADEPKANQQIKQKLLKKAQGEKLTQTQARDLVRVTQGKEPTAGAGDKNPRYLELNTEALGKSKFLKDKPDYSDSTFVVDIRAHKFLDRQNTAKDGEPEKLEEVWIDFESDELPPITSAADDQPEQEAEPAAV